MALRTCSICGKEAHTLQDLELFRKSKRNKYGRANLCSECTNKANREHYNRNKNRINKRRAERRLENLDVMREKDRIYREKNKEIIRQKSARYREKHRKKIHQKDQKKILFRDKRVYFLENPRKNICSECGQRYPEELKHQTVMHHENYNSDDPLENTIELCKSCHGKLHYRRGDMWGLDLP